ncbi:MAG: S-layer homology domain-containing protein [Oscillospiraceae bacterium]|nr:S-layer homology domain-containing protein [Oscillospiraceae bacterium]
MKTGIWRPVLAVMLCFAVGKSHQSLAVMPEVAPVPQALPAEEPFEDVSFGQRWYDGARYGYRRGLIQGLTERQFGGELPATRAMAATMVWRLAGEPAPLGQSNFIDVPSGWYYTDAVAWGQETGLLLGFGDGAFRPQEPITGGQLEQILDRYWGGEEVEAFRGTAFTAPDQGLSRGELAQTLMERCEERRGNERSW